MCYECKLGEVNRLAAAAAEHPEGTTCRLGLPFLTGMAISWTLSALPTPEENPI
jgi:hypothetical protein